MKTSFGPWSIAITTGANQQLSTFWKRRLAMLPSLNRSVSRAAGRTWLFLIAVGVIAVALPTAHTVTQPRIAGATDSAENGQARSAAQRGSIPADPSKKNEAGGMVEYLPRPTREEAALEEPLDFDAVEMPFDECIRLFAKRAKIKVVLDNETLADEGITVDQPVTLTVKGGRAGSVLNRLLEPLKLEFVVEEDQLKITTEWKASERLILRWYPVWDLSAFRELPQPQGDPAEISQQNAGMVGGGFGGGGMGGKTVRPSKFELINAITNTIQPDSWEDVSGPGSIWYVRDIQCLAIRQTRNVHCEILPLLRLWREAKQMERAAVAAFADDPSIKLKDKK
jgi:hypothetical protein